MFTINIKGKENPKSPELVKLEMVFFKSRNIPISVISEGMGHDSEATTQIYLASLDTAVVDRANNSIIKLLL